MGFRFQKRIKIAPGVRVNISKGGISTSVGPRGASVTVGKRGVRANVGIPGTGISYSEQLTSKRTKRPQGSRAPVRSKNALPASADTHEVEAYNAYVQMLRSIHLDTKEPVDWGAILDEDLMQFTEESPHTRYSRQQLAEFEPNWLDRLFRRGQAKKQELAIHLNEAIVKDQKLLAEKQQLHELTTRVLAHEEKAWLEILTTYDAFESVEKFGNHVHVQFREGTLILSLEMGEEKTVPEEVLSLTAKGNCSRKKMGKTNYYALYQDYVCSCMIGIARNLFALLPADSILIHAYDVSQADAPPVKGCIVSARISHEDLSDVLFDIMDASKLIESMEHHMNHLKTKGFRLVDELE
ncbi:DUF4236 domain-containing protein [Sporosarcina jeotgali]|uniref:DUF4236 domain-containing protein n=1 Tax=Sporosarcina jeotgali TaxID=3020056 RepID=A0ABZ0KUM1_9BACL|nr:DUF4236 domain-containing protein [Sporosarcina sp. B2O-1]WOV83660.1 DUF4236 domain-containing protein [Sporosarcina sp. B2O-1]